MYFYGILMLNYNQVFVRSSKDKLNWIIFIQCLNCFNKTIESNVIAPRTMREHRCNALVSCITWNRTMYQFVHINSLHHISGPIGMHWKKHDLMACMWFSPMYFPSQMFMMFPYLINLSYTFIKLTWLCWLIHRGGSL